MFLAPLPKPHHFFFFHFPLLPFFPFHSAYLFSYPALSFARFSPASSNLTRSNCVASTHSFTTCAFLTCLPLHQSLQMISSVLLSVQLFNLLQLSHASQLSPAISYPSPPAPKTPQNSFSHNNIFTFAIFTYFLHLSTAEPGSFKNPSSCFSNFVICLSFAFSLTSLIFSGLTSSSLQKPWRISFSTHFWFFSFPIISTYQPSIASLPLVF